jgi:hypothetical protein
VPPVDVVAFAERLAAYLERGRFAGIGRVDLGPEGQLPDAELAVQIALADVDHCAFLEGRGLRVTRGDWDDLAGQLRRLLGDAVERSP